MEVSEVMPEATTSTGAASDDGLFRDNRYGEGQCGDGFRIGNKAYVLTCGPLHMGAYPVGEFVLGSGQVMWSDTPIEVRTIVDTTEEAFVAVNIDPDICQYPPGDDAWYVASLGDEFGDWPTFCAFIGADLRTE